MTNHDAALQPRRFKHGLTLLEFHEKARNGTGLVEPASLEDLLEFEFPQLLVSLS